MLCVAAILILLLSVKAQNLSDVNYSFDMDFYKKFDSNNCDDKSFWWIVRYDSLNIKPLHMNSDKGIRALRRSCASSFPIIFFAGILEVNVYIKAQSLEFGINIEVFDEDDTSITQHAYGRSSEGFVQGWHTISLQINTCMKGYIQLRGTSLSNEIVVIDSFRYKPNNTNTCTFKKVKRSVNNNNANETENMYNKEIIMKEEFYEAFESTRKDNQDSIEENGIESSGVSGFKRILKQRSELGYEIDKETHQKKKSIWNPFSISMIAVALVIAATITGLSAYYCGKIKGTETPVPPIFTDDIELPRTITIPRVTGINKNISRFKRFD